MRFPSKKVVGAAIALGLVAAFVVALPAYAAVPAITSLSTVSAAPGTPVTITGTGFTVPSVTSVKFGGVNAPSFVVVSDTSITTSVPCLAVGSATVVVNNGADSNAQAFSATIAGVPTVASFSPASGTPAVTSVVITGTNLCGATFVRFNGVAATTMSANTPTSIAATVPTGATTGPVSITTLLGTGTSTVSFTIGLPVITSFSPSTGLAGAAVTITGTNLLNATAVNFNGITALFTVVNSTTITTTVPATATTGPIHVTNAVGTATSSTNFTVGTVSHSHARSVASFSYAGNRASGSVKSAFNACKAFVPVYIQQQHGGGWILLDTTATNASGHFSTWVPDRHGKFRATVKKQTLLGGTVCKGDSSQIKNHA